MPDEDIGEELKNPDSPIYQKIIAAFFYSLKLEYILKEEYIEFIRNFFKQEEIARAFANDKRKYLALKEQEASIRDEMRNLKKEKHVVSRQTLAEKKSIQELKDFIRDLAKDISSVEKDIEKDTNEIAEYTKTETQVNTAWNEKIDTVVKDLTGDLELNDAERTAVITEMKAVPIATTMATLGESYQKNAQENPDKPRPDTEVIAKFASTVLALKAVMALQKHKKPIDSNLQNFDKLVKKDFKGAHFDKTELSYLGSIFEKGSSIKESKSLLEEKIERLVDLKKMSTQAQHRLEEMEVEQTKPTSSNKSILSQRNIFSEKNANNQVSNVSHKNDSVVQTKK